MFNNQDIEMFNTCCCGLRLEQSTVLVCFHKLKSY